MTRISASLSLRAERLRRTPWPELIGHAWLVLIGGMFAVRVVRLTGLLFMIFGFAAVLMPQYGNIWLGAGFGALQTIGGIFIARRHGG